MPQHMVGIKRTVYKNCWQEVRKSQGTVQVPWGWGQWELLCSMSRGPEEEAPESGDRLRSAGPLVKGQ